MLDVTCQANPGQQISCDYSVIGIDSEVQVYSLLDERNTSLLGPLGLEELAAGFINLLDSSFFNIKSPISYYIGYTPKPRIPVILPEEYDEQVSVKLLSPSEVKQFEGYLKREYDSFIKSDSK